ncbi:MAG: outer membrane protein transport protein [Leptospira sp.]|nr:outer membrane protein transport protein [Leptospira sp.]
MNILESKYKYSIVFSYLIILKSLDAGSYGDTYGAHPAANARGNAVNAVVSGSAAVFYNPAGLARISDSDLAILDQDKRKSPNKSPEVESSDYSEFPWYMETAYIAYDSVTKDILANKESQRANRNVHEIAIQYNYAQPRLTTSVPNPDRLEGENDHYVGLGLALDFGNFYNLERKIKFGLNILAPANGNLLTINDQNPTVHRALQYGVQNERPTIMGGLGVEAWKDHLFLGVGFTALATGQGSILMKDVDISPEPTTPDQQAVLELKPLVNPTFGAQFHWGKFDLGISYKRETAVSIDPLAARAQTTLLAIQLDLDVALLGLYTPRIWSYGLAFSATDRLTISFDINRELWSGFRLSRTKQIYSEPFRLHDTTNYRTGVEYKWSDSLKLRAGYAKRPSPVGEMPGEANWIDFDRNIVTTGFGYVLFPDSFSFLEDLKNPILLDFVLEYQKLHGRHIFKYNATERNPNYSFGGNVWHIGGSITILL